MVAHSSLPSSLGSMYRPPTQAVRFEISSDGRRDDLAALLSNVVLRAWTRAGLHSPSASSACSFPMMSLIRWNTTGHGWFVNNEGGMPDGQRVVHLPCRHPRRKSAWSTFALTISLMAWNCHQAMKSMYGDRTGLGRASSCRRRGMSSSPTKWYSAPSWTRRYLSIGVAGRQRPRVVQFDGR